MVLTFSRFILGSLRTLSLCGLWHTRLSLFFFFLHFLSLRYAQCFVCTSSLRNLVAKINQFVMSAGATFFLAVFTSLVQLAIEFSLGHF